MIDNEAIEITSADELQGSLHAEMMKDEEESCHTDLLDMCSISASLCLPLAGLTPFIMITGTPGKEDDSRKAKLQLSQ